MEGGHVREEERLLGGHKKKRNIIKKLNLKIENENAIFKNLDWEEIINF